MGKGEKRILLFFIRVESVFHPWLVLFEVSMYKLLLCWRYLKTRYLALVCIVSVMLGVATLIVVNSVMAGFSTKLKERLHYLLSDIIIEAADIDGFPDPDGQMRKIRDSNVGPYVAAMTPQLEV